MRIWKTWVDLVEEEAVLLDLAELDLKGPGGVGQVVPAAMHQVVPAVTHLWVPVVMHLGVPAVMHLWVPVVMHLVVPAAMHLVVPAALHLEAHEGMLLEAHKALEPHGREVMNLDPGDLDQEEMHLASEAMHQVLEITGTFHLTQGDQGAQEAQDLY